MLSFVSIVAIIPLVSAHGFIKFAASDLAGTEKAQKTNVGGSAFRAVPDNTGWIGANFLTNEAIACGSSGTPFQTVAAPNGRQFAESGQTAGKHMPVKAGGKVTLTVSGNPGDGWPHPFGHVQVYMADCGESCIGADATKLGFFKTQSEINGIQNTLRKHYDASQDGHKYDVNIPKGLKDGKYMMRFELIAFGQSGANEGRQDQYYPFCGQLDVQGGTGELNNLATVSFPGAYKNGNIDQSVVPGPQVLATTSGGQAQTGNDGGNEVSTGKPPKNGGNGGSNTVTTPDNSSDNENNSSDNDDEEEEDCTDTKGPIALKSSAPACAATCLSIKYSEAANLAPNCSINGGAGCFCSTANFMGAYAQCVRDHCGGQAQAGIKALASQCGASSKKASHKLMKKMLVKEQNVKLNRRLANHSRRAHKDNHRVKRSSKINTIFEEVVGVARLTKN